MRSHEIENVISLLERRFGDSEKVSKRVAISNLLEIVSTDEFKDKYLYICRGSSHQKPFDWISKVKREIQLKKTIF